MADNIQISELLESTTAANNDWIAIDNGTATKKISVQNFNATGAASAAQSAAAAAQSASAALASQTAAEQAEDDTQALITSAQTIVSSAQTYANEASTSAGTASTAANTATAQAALATQAATQAGTYAQNVDTFAKNAKSWAVGGTGTRQGEDTDNSKYYSQQAHASEINAATSETNAATSEANAAASEQAVIDSAYFAHQSMMDAAVSASSASSSATTASDSATSAASDAQRASTFALQANNSKETAEDCADTSQAWAWGKVDGVDVPPTHPAYHNNAKYYADQASGGVSGVSSFNARSGNVVPALGDYSANIVEFDNSSNGFTATDTQAAIEEVQDNVDDVATDLSTLDGSLKPVAKSGAYNDLTGLPTLGTAAAKNSTNAVSSGSTDLVESGAVYTGLSVKANSADLGTAAGKNFTTSVTSGSTDLVTSGAVKSAIDNIPSTWSALTGKPFNTVGNGLTVSNDALTADIKTVTTEYNGSASATNTRFHTIRVNGSNVGTIDGSTYMEQTQTLSTSADTVYTFTNAAITANSAVDVYTNIYGINPSNVVTTSGQCVVTFPKQSTAQTMTCRIYVK
jgi:hypothetical protein